jgi:hypothetical protein
MSSWGLFNEFKSIRNSTTLMRSVKGTVEKAIFLLCDLCVFSMVLCAIKDYTEEHKGVSELHRALGQLLRMREKMECKLWI